MRSHEPEKLLSGKGHHPQDKAAAYKMGKDTNSKYDKGLISKLQKEFKKVDINKTKIANEKGGTDLNKELLTE